MKGKPTTRYRVAAWTVLAVDITLCGLITWIGATVTSIHEWVLHDHTLANVLGWPVVLVWLVSLVLILQWIVDVEEANLAIRQERDKAIREEVETLEREHPELAALQRLLVLTQDVKEEKSGNRTFWVGFAQNAFFLVLGFIISFILAKLRVL